MFEYFTDRARQAVVASQDEALALGHDFIGTEHLLLGLAGTIDSTAGEVLRDHGVEVERARTETVRLLTAAGVVATGGRPATDALATLGIDVAEIQKRADENFGPGAFTYPRPAYTPGAQDVLRQTVQEAQSRGREHMGTEHMLLGLLAGGEGAALDVLAALEVETTALRTSILDRIDRQDR